MKSFRIAGAQVGSVRGDLEFNIKTHLRFVRVAVENNVDIIVFPELSLTGYEPEIAEEFAISINDVRLAPLKEQAQRHGITIVAGSPIARTGENPYIGALIFGRDDSLTYLKNHLHPGEEKYFSPGPRRSCVVNVGGESIGIAICADVNHASHAAGVKQNGASVYAAGVLMMDGYDTTSRQMRHYAIEHSMLVVMANYGFPTGGYVPAGKSAIWDCTGDLLSVADEEGSAMVMGTRGQSGWTGTIISI